MRKSLVTLLPATLAFIAFAAPAVQAGSATHHRVRVRIKSATVTRAGGFAIDAGRVTGSSGEGAALIGTKTAGGHRIATPVKLFYPSGEQRLFGITVYRRDRPGSDTFTITGRLHFTGGTRRFRGISGHVRFHAHVDEHGHTTTRLVGGARY